MNDLTSYPWIAPPVDSPLYHDLRAGLEGIGVKHFKISFTGGSLSAVINILSESDALTVLPYSFVFRMRPQNRLTALSIRIGDPERHLEILTLTNNLLEPAAKRLMNYITTEFKSLVRSFIIMNKTNCGENKDIHFYIRQPTPAPRIFHTGITKFAWNYSYSVGKNISAFP